MNLQLGVSEVIGNLTYYYFDEPALNTFDSEIVESRHSNTHYRVIKTSNIAVERLENILEKHLPIDTKIDFLSIDVEGLDFSVLRSNDWSLYRPSYVMVESLETSLEDAMQGDIYKYMQSHAYELFAQTQNTLIFRERNSCKSDFIDYLEE